jgi:hypothetical protein
MNDSKITREIVQRIVQRQQPPQIREVEAWLLDQPDKVDPFNMWVVLGVKARVNGKRGAWVIQTRNDNSGEVVSRLIDGDYCQTYSG